MSYRITTNGMLRNYQSNLYKNTKKVYDTMEKVQTGRKFNSYAENPVAASTAFRFRRSYWNAGNQIDNSNYVISKFSTGWNALDQIIDGDSEHPGLTGIEDALRALNDPIGSSRRTLGQDMLSMAKSVVMLMNVKYGDEFVFAGADGLNVPFTWGESGELCYRGVSVNAPKTLTEDQYNALLNGLARAAAGVGNLPTMDAYDKFAEYLATNGAEYDPDYEAWFNETNPKIGQADFEAAYGELDNFEDYVAAKATENAASYDKYKEWYASEFGWPEPGLTEDEFDELNGDYSSLPGYEDFVKADVIDNASYADYTQWRDELDPPPAEELKTEQFGVLVGNYDELNEFKQSLGDEPIDDGQIYAAYENWFDEKNGKLEQQDFDNLNGDYSSLEGFAEYYVENRTPAPTYDEYQAWYVNEYVDGAASGKLSEEEFADLTDEDHAKMTGYEEVLNETLSDYKTYSDWWDETHTDVDPDDPAAPKLTPTEFAEKLKEGTLAEIDEYEDYAGYAEYEAYEKWYTDQQFEKAAIRFDEATYVDIGIGLEFDANGNVIPSSAFNSALSGLDFLGFGADEDGDPLNIVELMRSLGELFESCDPDTGTYPEVFTYNGVTYHNSPDGEVEELANRLTNKLHDAMGRVTEQHVALDSKVNYLQKNKGQLESKRYDMNEQIENIEQEDPAVAIMDWSWARMTYQAALQIGNSILSHSLLDYMN